jgi:hypothetical protein
MVAVHAALCGLPRTCTYTEHDSYHEKREQDKSLQTMQCLVHDCGVKKPTTQRLQQYNNHSHINLIRWCVGLGSGADRPTPDTLRVAHS